MISSTTRNSTPEEVQQQLKNLPSAYKRFEDFTIKFLFISFALLVPLLIYNRYKPVATETQAIYGIIIILLACLITFWITKKHESRKRKIDQIRNVNSLLVEVIKVKTERAIKRQDPDDFGVAFYIDVIDNGQHKSLYLWGQYLDELEFDLLFPNTEFEFTRKVGSYEFMDFQTTGQYFKEEKTLPAFGKEVWNSGNFPVNGQILDITLDEIV